MSGIAIVGQGYMGRTHADAWARLGRGDQLLYLVAPGERESEDVAPGATFTTDLAAALADERVDRVSVCTPTASHEAIAVQALKAGKHVLLEKPVALDLGAAARIAAEADRSTGIVMVAQVVRFFAGYERLVEVARSGRIGRVRSVRASRALARPLWAPWWPDEGQSGGVPVDFAIHDYDQANLVLGTPVTVSATRTSEEGPLETTITYADGGLAQILSFPYLPQGSAFSSSLELVGERGQASYRLLAGAPTDSGAAGESRLTVATPEGVDVVDVPDNDPYLREVEYFDRCVELGHQPLRSTLASAIAALEVSLSVRSSLRRGQPVSL